jgi:hypothetical protein
VQPRLQHFPFHCHLHRSPAPLLVRALAAILSQFQNISNNFTRAVPLRKIIFILLFFLQMFAVAML